MALKLIDPYSPTPMKSQLIQPIRPSPQVDLAPFLRPPTLAELPELPDAWWWSETIWSVATEMIVAQELRAANNQEGTAPTAQRRKHLDPLEVPEIGQTVGQKCWGGVLPEDVLVVCMRILRGSCGFGWVYS